MSGAMKLGIVGTGALVLKSYLPLLAGMREVDVRALCDVDEERLQRAAAMAPAAATYADADGLLERKDLDAILIATPTDRHADLAIRALEEGFHLFLEKPMAPTLDEVERILTAWRGSGRLLQVGYVYRSSPLIRRFVEIAARDLGSLHQFWVHEFRAAFYDPWRYDPLRSGGSLLEKICHHADIANWLARRPPRKVAAIGGQARIRAGETVAVPAVDGSDVEVTNSGVPDHAWVIAEHEGGFHASYGMNLVAPYGIHGRDLADRESLEIGVLGTGGMLVCYVRQGRIVQRVFDAGERRVIDVPLPAGGWHTGTREQLEAFAASVLDGAPVVADGEVGARGMLLPLAAQRAMETGTMVDVEGESP